MKNIKILIALLLCLITYSTQAQADAGSVVGVPTGTTNQINAITTANQGSIAYNTETEQLMVFSTTNTWINVSNVLISTDPANKITLGTDNGLYVNPSAKVKAITSPYLIGPQDNGFILISKSNTAANTIVEVKAGLPVGFNISLYQVGTSEIVILADTANGVTVNNRLNRYKTAGKHAGIGLVCTETNVFYLTGDLKK